MRFILTAAAMLVLANVPSRLLAEPAKPASQPTPKVNLYKGLGKHTRPVATSNPEAQKFFDQGLNFMYAFNHDEAVRAFRRAAELDPDCAMAHWGVSLSVGKNYNYPFFPPAKAQAAWQALESARAKAKSESEANRALVEALAARYADPLPKETRPLEEAYARAMKAVWQKFPKDADIGALYAESLMNLRPWDLWTTGGKPQPETPEILRTLEAVMELDPKHPLANHLYIHACEASPHPEKADAAADRLRHLQPALGHMVHMPSHIDVRRGRWQAAIEANERAITADRNYAKTAPEQGFYRMYMAHNHHMLAFAAMMQGESKRALTAVRAMLAGVPKDWVALPENAAIADGYVAAPLEVMKRFGQWDEILKEPAPPEIFPIARAMRHHIRAIAYAAKGETAKAREEQKAFREAAQKPSKDATFSNSKVTDLFALGDDMLEGEILVREGKMAAGIKALRAAVAKEDQLRYSEPPAWVVPVRHALGAVLLKNGQATEAEAVYREDLRRWPANGWSLFGLAASLEAQDKKVEAAAVRAKFEEIWKHADVKIPSSCYCQEFLAVAAMAADNANQTANEKDQDTKLSLSSGYGHGLPGVRVRSVHLSVTLDDKGGGKGTLVLDPNSLGIDQFGDFTGKATQIAPQVLQVTLEEVKFKDQPKGERRLFEVKGHGLDNRLFLSIPPRDSTTYRLVTVDKEGNGLNVLLLEPSSGK